jgi:hypothetical protein
MELRSHRALSAEQEQRLNLMSEFINNCSDTVTRFISDLDQYLDKEAEAMDDRSLLAFCSMWSKSGLHNRL